MFKSQISKVIPLLLLRVQDLSSNLGINVIPDRPGHPKRPGHLCIAYKIVHFYTFIAQQQLIWRYSDLILSLI